MTEVSLLDLGLSLFDSKVRPASLRGRGKKTAALATAVQQVLADFDGSMSTRQIFYQLVSGGHVNNCQSSYDAVQRLLVTMRQSGEVPYERIVDRTRGKHQRPGWDGVKDIMQSVAEQYRRDLWTTQAVVPMIGCEKQALEGVFSEVVDEFGASLWTLRGYASESFAYEWATEIDRLSEQGKDVAIWYFGDHDPSGLGIEHDTRDKLRRHGAQFDWERRGLLESDFDRFQLVNVPVKATDSRAAGYVQQHGDRAAELDALRPDELRRRIRDAILECLDTDAWKRLQRAEQAERESLQLVTSNWNKAVQAVGANG